MRVKNWFFLIISFIFHLAAVGILYYFWLPIAKWYWDKIPIRGIDFFNTVTYVKYLSENLVWRAGGWKDIWFSGVPLSGDYPGLHFYLIQPLLGFFGLIRSVQVYMLASIFLFAAFSYLLFWQLARTRAVALILALAVALSVAQYGALVWGGSLPFFASQMFYPLSLYLLIRFLVSGDRRWFYLSALITGIAIFGHPLVPIIYILPSAAILIFLWLDEKTSLFSLKKVKDFSLYLGLVVLIGFIEVRYLFVDVLKLTLGRIGPIFNLLSGKPMTTAYNTDLNVAAFGSTAEQEFARNQLASIITQTNRTIFVFGGVFAGLFFLSLLLRRKKKTLFGVLPGAVLSVYLVGYISLYAFGIPFFHGGWYRTFWAVPVVFGLLVAWLWGNMKESFGNRFGHWAKKIKGLNLAVLLVLNLAILAVGAFVLQYYSQTVIDEIDTRGIASSAFPDLLNTVTTDKELEGLKDNLVPAWLDPQDKNYRLYINDATVNIWWNSLFDVPLARGYVDPPLSTPERWGLFWLDAVMGVGAESTRSSLEVDWEVPPEVVDNNTKFLLDWYAIKCLEGNHFSLGNSLLAEHITSGEFIDMKETATVSGILKRYETVSGKEEWDPKGEQALHYYRLRDELTSPILSPTNAPSFLLIGSDVAYDTLVRFLGQVNLNSQKLILAKGPKFIDKLTFSDLKNFDGLILYDYDYRNWDKTWRLIDRYVKNGGKVFVDTGPGVKESDTTKLPAKFPSELPGVFPIKRTVREDLGQHWEPEAAEILVTEGIDFSQFSLLDFDGEPWNISHPIDDGDIREETKVILRHQGIPVVAERAIGEGKVIWSGFNLPYHIIRDHNPHEAQFFVNILADLVGISESVARPESLVEWRSPQEVVIKEVDAKGVVFKQQAFAGWRAEIKANPPAGGQKAKIYKVGPTSPGFMYVSLRGATKPVSVVFKYRGGTDVWFFTILSWVTALILFDIVVLNKRVLGRLLEYAGRKIRKSVGRWWERDEYD